MKLRFTQKHMELFSAASGDVNPLHLSAAYARQTPYGQPVVFGALGFLMCLAQMPQRPVLSASVEFRGAMFTGIDYDLVLQDGMAELMDGGSLLLRMKVTYGGEGAGAALPEKPVFPRSIPRVLAEKDITGGLSFGGSYAPARAAFEALLSAVELQGNKAAALAAMGASYAAGMELPGESAALSGFSFDISGAAQLPADLAVSVEKYDARFGLLSLAFSLRFCSGKISALLRPPAPLPVAPLPYAGPFAGKTVIITGASRGLGAAFALQLAAQGAAVVGIYAQSKDRAAGVMAAAKGLPGTVSMAQGDITNSAFCALLAAKFPQPDLLICSAAPPLQPMLDEPVFAARMEEYIGRGLTMVKTPLEVFDASSVLLVSSSAVEDPPRVWPHYVRMKKAAEEIVAKSAAARPDKSFFIARPQKILTDMVNTPMGRMDAEEAGDVARRILDGAAKAGGAGKPVYI